MSSQLLRWLQIHGVLWATPPPPNPTYLTVHKKVEAHVCCFRPKQPNRKLSNIPGATSRENQGLVRKLLPFNMGCVSGDPAVSPCLAAMPPGWVSSFLKPGFAYSSKEEPSGQKDFLPFPLSHSLRAQSKATRGSPCNLLTISDLGGSVVQCYVRARFLKPQLCLDST